MNILLTSVGRRVNIVEYFCSEFAYSGKVIACDCSKFAPALYVAHAHEVIPAIDDSRYLSSLLDVCERYAIKAIVSLLDPELVMLSRNQEEFEQRGIRLIQSDYGVIQTCVDKYATFQHLQKHSLPHIPTYLERSEIEKAIERGALTYPFVAKPRMGAASIGYTLVYSERQWNALLADKQDVVVQPYLEGPEFGVDAYVDLISGDPIAIFTKRKLQMRAGETDKSVTVVDEELEKLILKLLETLNFRGPLDIDCFSTENGYVISEINPRFGGGYPHAFASGLNFMSYIKNNMQGVPNHPMLDFHPRESVLLKYDRFLIV